MEALPGFVWLGKPGSVRLCLAICSALQQLRSPAAAPLLLEGSQKPLEPLCPPEWEERLLLGHQSCSHHHPPVNSPVLDPWCSLIWHWSIRQGFLGAAWAWILGFECITQAAARTLLLEHHSGWLCCSHWSHVPLWYVLASFFSTGIHLQWLLEGADALFSCPSPIWDSEEHGHLCTLLPLELELCPWSNKCNPLIGSLPASAVNFLDIFKC